MTTEESVTAEETNISPLEKKIIRQIEVRMIKLSQITPLKSCLLFYIYTL